MAQAKKKLKTSNIAASKPLRTKCNWLFSAEKITLRELNRICFSLFNRDENQQLSLTEEFDYAIIATSETNNAFTIFGYVQLKISSRWTSKQLVEYLGYDVRTYGPNDIIFGVVEKQLKPSDILIKLKAKGAHGNVTECGKVRSKGKKSAKPAQDEEEEEESEESSEDYSDDELNHCDLFITRASSTITDASPGSFSGVGNFSNDATRRSNFGVGGAAAEDATFFARRSNIGFARAAPENDTIFVSKSSKRSVNVDAPVPPFYDMSSSPARLIRVPRGSFDPVQQRENAISNSFITYQDQLVTAIGVLLDDKLNTYFTHFSQDVYNSISDIMKQYQNAEVGNTIQPGQEEGASFKSHVSSEPALQIDKAAGNGGESPVDLSNQKK
jgi:hypothetical protein